MKRIAFLILAVCSVAPAFAALQIQSWTLANGARVLFVENHSIPILDVSVEFDAGARRDPNTKGGLALLTQSMLAAGVRAGAAANEPALTEAQISDAFADTAAQRGGGVGMDRAGMTLRTLSSRSERDASIALMARILAQPSFPADIWTREKARAISAIKEKLTKPEAIAERSFAGLLYGDHPYGKRDTIESVEAIAREDLIEFHRIHYIANRAIIAMIGDLSRAEAEAIAQQLTARLPQGAPLPSVPDIASPHGREQRIDHPASQSHILIGLPALARRDPDYFALLVGNHVLGGGGFVSRMMQEVREKRGLAYSVYSLFNPMAQKGPFQIGLQTQREQTEQALKVARDTLQAFLRDGPTDAELKAAKDNLIGGFPLRIDNNRKILDNIAAIGFYQLPLDYLDTWTANVGKISRADIQTAFARKVVPEQMGTVVVGAPKP